MSNYCGYIYVWKNFNLKNTTYQSGVDSRLMEFERQVAIFKIKLDGGFNKHKTQDK